MNVLIGVALLLIGTHTSYLCWSVLSRGKSKAKPEFFVGLLVGLVLVFAGTHSILEGLR